MVASGFSRCCPVSAMRCASCITAWEQYARELTIWRRDFFARHLSKADVNATQDGRQRDAWSSSRASIRAQSSGESRNRLVPRAR